MKIDMNIRNAFGRLCIPLLALGVFSASCTDELSSEVVSGGSGKGGESEVTLKLQVPGTDAGAKTRAVTEEEENEIDDLYVLAFKVDKDNNEETFDYYVAAKKMSTAGTSGELSTWTASLKVKDYRQTFVMIANAQGTTGKVNEQIAALAGNSVGHSKMQMLAKLTETLSEDEKTKGFNADSNGSHHPFTMYGQTDATLITENGGHNLTVSMHRIMAQVRVTFSGDAANDARFEAESVLLYNFNDRARVIPDNLVVTGTDYVKTPTIPQGAVLLPAKADGKESVPTYTVDPTAKKITHAIYLFETVQPVDGTELEKHVKRPCLIVKGKYQQEATSCYYRVDLATTDAGGTMNYMDVLRNHSYNVTISNVTDRGHDTPQEALESKPANITATVVAWDDAEMGDIDFDGQRVLGIGTMKYQLGKRGGNDLLQQVKASTGLAWTATLYAADEYGQATTNAPDWIKFVGTDGAETQTISGVGTNELEDWKFNVKRNEDVPERRAVMRFTAGNLKVDALVVQDQSNPVYINVKIDGKIITEEEFEQLGGWCRGMTIEYGPENTELTWRYTGRGVELSQTEAGGVATTDMEGTASSGNSEDAILTWKGEAKELAGVDALDYATKDGVLTLIAKGQQGMEAKSIRLFQKKYGVMLTQTLVPCDGRVQHIYVKGNMPWKSTMNADDLNNIIDKNMLRTAYNSDMGDASDEPSNTLSRLTFDTDLADLRTGLVEATMIFRHANNNAIGPFEKKIRLAGVLNYSDGQKYLVLGPVQRSLKDIENKVPYTHPDGTVDKDAFIIDANHTSYLDKAGLDWEISGSSRLKQVSWFSSEFPTIAELGQKYPMHYWEKSHTSTTVHDLGYPVNNWKMCLNNAHFIADFKGGAKYTYLKPAVKAEVYAQGPWSNSQRIRFYVQDPNYINFSVGYVDAWDTWIDEWYGTGEVGVHPGFAGPFNFPVEIWGAVRGEWFKLVLSAGRYVMIDLSASNNHFEGVADENISLNTDYKTYYLKLVN